MGAFILVLVARSKCDISFALPSFDDSCAASTLKSCSALHKLPGFDAKKADAAMSNKVENSRVISNLNTAFYLHFFLI